MHLLFYGCIMDSVYYPKRLSFFLFSLQSLFIVFSFPHLSSIVYRHIGTIFSTKFSCIFLVLLHVHMC